MNKLLYIRLRLSYLLSLVVLTAFKFIDFCGGRKSIEKEYKPICGQTVLKANNHKGGGFIGNQNFIRNNQQTNRSFENILSNNQSIHHNQTNSANPSASKPSNQTNANTTTNSANPSSSSGQTTQNQTRPIKIANPPNTPATNPSNQTNANTTTNAPNTSSSTGQTTQNQTQPTKITNAPNTARNNPSNQTNANTTTNAPNTSSSTGQTTQNQTQPTKITNAHNNAATNPSNQTNVNTTTNAPNTSSSTGQTTQNQTQSTKITNPPNTAPNNPSNQTNVNTVNQSINYHKSSELLGLKHQYTNLKEQIQNLNKKLCKLENERGKKSMEILEEIERNYESIYKGLYEVCKKLNDIEIENYERNITLIMEPKEYLLMETSTALDRLNHIRLRIEKLSGKKDAPIHTIKMIEQKYKIFEEQLKNLQKDFTDLKGTEEQDILKKIKNQCRLLDREFTFLLDKTDAIEPGKDEEIRKQKKEFNRKIREKISIIEDNIEPGINNLIIM